jgi:hypothetical protein
VIPQEQPPPGTHCVVETCELPATVYVDVADGQHLEGASTAPMCDDHAAHWRDAQS